MAVGTTFAFPLTVDQLEEINEYLATLEPSDIISWGLVNLPALYQSTAFGLTGLAGTDMASKLTSSPPELIFIDTMHHFQETLDLKDEVQQKYGLKVHVYGAEGVTNSREFAAKYGRQLWSTDESLYDYVAKVEPAQRAYRELGVESIITGRRASQGGARTHLKPLEVDSTGLHKLNPFFSWTFGQVQAYLDENKVPRNALLSQGYKSVGDWHNTAKSGEGDAGERAGRWAGKEKTECGLHQDYFKLKRLAFKTQREAELRSRDESFDPQIEHATLQVVEVSA
ncbi:hypothetical protein BS47DRAFT_1343461 [Hydnum rufescens UP504]|uniref:Phosphoadenosine phosphosulphate reductase domain-containing protein n=1 Tax=Hydnum rufescens UP504 TaxID=1448309 RepID=A0A9P6DX03_9AGAM|nr:hypothetical protein BS47DRAFT_1343461 [Hydnum rufescens UP504]